MASRDGRLSTGHSALNAYRGIVTREAMIEYCNLQRWSRQTCMTMPLTMGLWLSLMALVSYRAHTEASFAIRQAMTNHVTALEADLSKGLSPRNLPSELASQGDASCTCACAPGGYSLCQPQSPMVAGFNGSMRLDRLKFLRAKSEYFQGTARPQRPLKWDQLRTMQEVWFWVQHAFIPEVWHEVSSNVPVKVDSMFGSRATIGDPGQEPGSLLIWSQLVGGVRLRQRRIQTEVCNGDPDVTAIYGQTCHSSSPSVSAFGPAGLKEGYYAEGFMPEAAERGAFDVYFNLKTPIYEVLETMEHMLKAMGWLDDATEELLLQAAFLNGEAVPPLYGLLEVRFIFDRSGALRHSVNVQTTAADDYPSAVYIALDIAWVSLVFLLLMVNLFRVLQRCLNPGKAEEHPLLSFWTALDWVTVLVSLGIFAGRLLISLDASRVAKKMSEVPPSPPAFGAELAEVKAYHGTWGGALDNVIHITQWMEYYRLALFAYTIVLTFQMFKVFRGQPKLAQMANALRHAVEDLIHFVVVFLVLFLSFAFTGYMIYGLSLPEWSRPARAVNTCFRSLLGDTDLAAMYEVAPVSTVVWYYLFLTLMIFLMLNLLLAITYDHFVIVKSRSGQTAGIMLQIRLFLGDLRSRTLGRGCMGLLCCCCRRDPGIPRHSDVIEELLRRCDLTHEEKASAYQSVLGLRMARKERKRHAFAEGEGNTNQTVKLMGFPAEKDLQSMSVDPDYIEVLLDDASAQARREHGREEGKVAQLRQLVNIAESDIVIMRERLATCGGLTKHAMYELTSRLEVLERMVHCSLADLVMIAGAAGVPDAKPATTPGQRAKLDSTVGALRSLSAQERSETLLTGSVSRVLEHLSQGNEAAKETKASIEDWHRAMRRIDTRGKRIGQP